MDEKATSAGSTPLRSNCRSSRDVFLTRSIVSFDTFGGGDPNSMTPSTTFISISRIPFR